MHAGVEDVATREGALLDGVEGAHERESAEEALDEVSEGGRAGPVEVPLEQGFDAAVWIGGCDDEVDWVLGGFGEVEVYA